MRSADCLIGVDVGSSAVKAVAVSVTDMDVIASGRAPTPELRAGRRVETPLNELRTAVFQTLREVTAALPQRSRVVGIATTSYGEAGAHLDSKRRVLRDSISWQDQRSADQVSRLVARVGADRLDAQVGHAPDPTWGIGRIMWVAENEPDVMARTACWLPIADLVTFWLCGSAVTSPSLGSRLMIVDQNRSDWSREALAGAGIDPAILPPLVESGTVVGAVTGEAAEESGLPTATPVAVGGHDRQCGAFAARGTRRLPVDSVGTAEALIVPVSNDADPRGTSCSGFAWYRDVVPEQYTLAGRVGLAGGLLEWGARALFGDAATFEDLLEGVSTPYRHRGAVATPALGRATTPFWAPGPVATAFGGVTASTTRAELVQALLEAPAFSLRANLDEIDRMTGRSTDQFLVEGGLVASPAAVQLRADATGRIAAAVQESAMGAIGAALLAGVGAGTFANHREAEAAFQPTLTLFEPEPTRSAEYAEAFESVWLPLAALGGRRPGLG